MTTTLARPVAPTMKSSRSRSPVVLAGLAFCLYAWFSWLQWTSFITPSYDLGIFSQIADRYSHFEAPITTILGQDFNALGDHFHPMLVVLGPVYALFPTPFVLLLVQNLLFAASVYVVAAFAISQLGRLSGLLLGVAYALSWGIQSAVEAQFHAVSFAVPILAMALVALLRQRWWLASALAASLVLIKEDLGLTVAVFGLVLAWRARSWWGLTLSAWGMVWFVLTVMVLIPWFNPEGDWTQGEKLGLTGLLEEPGSFFQLSKLMTVALLLLVTLGIGLTSPIYLMVIPTLAWRFLGDNPYFWGHFWQYSAILMPVVFLAAIDVLHRRAAVPEDDIRVVDARPRQLTLPGGSAEPQGTSVAQRPRIGSEDRVQVGICAAMLLVAVGISFQMPFGKLLFPGDHFRQDARPSAEAALSQIRSSSVVETDRGLMNYLVTDHTIYYVGHPDNPVPDYFVIAIYDANADADTAEHQAEAWHPGHNFRTVHSDAYFQVARRTS